MSEQVLCSLADRGCEPAVDELLARYERDDPELFQQVMKEVQGEYMKGKTK